MATKTKREWILEKKNSFYNKKLNKPKNRKICPLRGREKVQFQSKIEALRFIEYNSEGFHYGESWRPYYCPACCCWHITHTPESNGHIADERDLQKIKAILEPQRRPENRFVVNTREDVIDNLFKLPTQLFELTKKEFSNKLLGFTITGKAKKEFREILFKIHKFRRTGADFINSVVAAISSYYNINEPIIIET